MGTTHDELPMRRSLKRIGNPERKSPLPRLTATKEEERRGVEGQKIDYRPASSR